MQPYILTLILNILVLPTTTTTTTTTFNTHHLLLSIHICSYLLFISCLLFQIPIIIETSLFLLFLFFLLFIKDWPTRSPHKSIIKGIQIQIQNPYNLTIQSINTTLHNPSQLRTHRTSHLSPLSTISLTQLTYPIPLWHHLYPITILMHSHITSPTHHNQIVICKVTIRTHHTHYIPHLLFLFRLYRILTILLLLLKMIL